MLDRGTEQWAWIAAARQRPWVTVLVTTSAACIAYATLRDLEASVVTSSMATTIGFVGLSLVVLDGGAFDPFDEGTVARALGLLSGTLAVLLGTAATISVSSTLATLAESHLKHFDADLALVTLLISEALAVYMAWCWWATRRGHAPRYTARAAWKNATPVIVLFAVGAANSSWGPVVLTAICQGCWAFVARSRREQRRRSSACT